MLGEMKVSGYVVRVLYRLLERDGQGLALPCALGLT